MIEYIITKPSLSESEVTTLIEKIISETDISTPTTISLFPKYIESAGIAIGDSSNITICSISTGSLYSYPEVAVLECSMACENGADQIEVAIGGGENGDSDFSQTEGYLKIVADEIEDMAEFSILISEECNNIEQIAEQAIRAALDLNTTIISYGICNSPIDGVAVIAKIIEKHNTVSEYKIILRIIADINNTDGDTTEFVNNNSLSELYKSSSLILRAKI